MPSTRTVWQALHGGPSVLRGGVGRFGQVLVSSMIVVTQVGWVPGYLIFVQQNLSMALPGRPARRPDRGILKHGDDTPRTHPCASMDRLGEGHAPPTGLRSTGKHGHMSGRPAARDCGGHYVMAPSLRPMDDVLPQVLQLVVLIPLSWVRHLRVLGLANLFANACVLTGKMWPTLAASGGWQTVRLVSAAAAGLAICLGYSAFVLADQGGPAPFQLINTKVGFILPPLNTEGRTDGRTEVSLVS